MADMSPRYMKYVRGYTGYLYSEDVEKRRKGARMVGELGAAETIERLLELAESDPDAQVRRNARYSLGMFAAFKEAIESEDEAKQDEAAAALTRVMERGKIGERARYSPKLLGRVLAALSVLLVVLLAANGAVFFMGDGSFPVDVAGLGGGFAGNGGAPAAGNNSADQSAEALVARAQSQMTLLAGNVDKLQELYDSVGEDGTPVMDMCLLPYTTTEPLELSEGDRSAYPEVAAVYDDLAASRDEIISTRQRAEQACFDEMPLSATEVETRQAMLQDFENNVSNWQSTLEQALVVPTATPSPVPTDAPTVAPTQGPTATPTETPDLRVHAANLSGIIDDAVNNPRSPGQLLTQYYRDAQANNGDTDGCRRMIGVPPENVPQVADIPSDYVLPEVVANYSPEMVQATAQVNAGLQVLRDGWVDFAQACNDSPNAVLSTSVNGLTVTSTARAAFDNANETIQQVLQREREG